MKQRNKILLIAGIILVGLLLISGMTDFSFNTLNPEGTHDVEQPQSTDNDPQIIQNPLENIEPNTEDTSSLTNDASSNDNSNAT